MLRRTLTDERGNTTEYVRNADHSIQQINYPNNSGNGPDYPEYPQNGYETFTYNSFRQIENHLMPNGGTEHFQYDNRGLKTFSWPPDTSSDPSPEDRKTQYFYYNAANSSPDHFYRIDRLWYVVNPRGYMTWYDYDERGHVTRVTYDNGNHDYNQGPFIESYHNGDGTLAWTKDELHHLTSFEYDAYKRVTRITKVVNGVNEVTQNDYTPLTGGLGPLSHATSSVYRVTSPTGKETEYDYDRNFRRTMMRQAPGTDDEAITYYDYDPAGNLDWVQDPRGYVTRYGYDERNRQTSVTNVTLNETTTVTYDAASNKIVETRLRDEPPSFRSWDYDSMNRLHHAYDWRTNPSPAQFQTTTYTRDPGGNVRKLTDTKGAVYEYVYDWLNRKIRTTYPPDGSLQQRHEEWQYDYAGNLYMYTNPDGKERRFDCDPRNRPYHSWWETGVGQDIMTVYDAASRVQSITTNNGETVVSFGYDDANRKIWEDQKVGNFPAHRVKTDVDSDGKRLNLQIIDPPEVGGNLVASVEMSGTGTYSLSYEYTERNQLEHIYGEDHLWEINYIYDPSGNMTSRETVAHGVSTWTNCPTEDYDALNRPKRWEQNGANGFHAVSHHEYDHANREVATWREGNPTRGDRFAYDPTNQLVGAAYNATFWGSWPAGGATRTVNYDYSSDNLNRDTMTVNGAPTNYSHNLLNQYIQVGGANCTYDSKFNLATMGAFSGTYDAANHLLSASNTGSPDAPSPMIASFVYDGLGRIVTRTLNGVETILTYDGWKPGDVPRLVENGLALIGLLGGNLVAVKELVFEGSA